MKILTDDSLFNFSDWVKEPITDIYAGCGCVMALLWDGRTLYKSIDGSSGPDPCEWSRIKQIAISRIVFNAAIGLREDGSCALSFDPFDPFETDPARVIRDWKNIKQVAASDAFFGLDSDGRVHYAWLSSTLHDRYDDYAATAEWKNVRKIIAHSTQSVFGITEDGHVLCAGRKTTNGPHGDLRERIASISGVRDVCTYGAECDGIFILLENGTVIAFPRGDILRDQNGISIKPLMAPNDRKVIDGHVSYYLYILTNEQRLCCIGRENTSSVFPEEYPVRSFAMGDNGRFAPFVVALAEY